MPPPSKRRRRGTRWSRAKKKKPTPEQAERDRTRQAETVLHRLYYDPSRPAGFAGYQQLRREALKLNVEPWRVRKWLQAQPSYTLHQPAQRRFRRRRVLVNGMDEQWQADLADVSKLAESNDGVNFLLIVIDVLSRHAWVTPLLRKTGVLVTEAFEDLFAQGRVPDRLQTDEGTEFLNSNLKALLKQHSVHPFVVYGDAKAQIVERFIRTLKTRMWRYFTANDTHRYLDVLPDLVKGYNDGYHRTIGRSPASVTHDNAQEVWHRLYDDEVPPVDERERESDRRRARPRFRPGDRVRLSVKAKVFKKGYTPNWTEEVFVIDRRVPGQPFLYKIREWDESPVTGSFYESELKQVDVKATDLFRIESVLKRRHRRGQTPEVLVQWRGWPEKYNCWIAADEVRDLKKEKEEEGEEAR